MLRYLSKVANQWLIGAAYAWDSSSLEYDTLYTYIKSMFSWNLRNYKAKWGLYAQTYFLCRNSERNSELMANFNPHFPFLRCENASRGCTSVSRSRLFKLWHQEECGFAPVQCSHDGSCEATVNRQDLVSHQQNCEFRSVTCDDCHETMRQQEYGKHICALRRELARVTRTLRDIQDEQVSTCTRCGFLILRLN